MTNTELAILSLLAEKSRHGYEIEQTIEERGMREWTEIGFSSIYYILKKCLQAGWVEERLYPSESKGPGKKVYKLTESGREAWQTAALGMLETPSKTFRPLDLGLANLPLLPASDSITALMNYRKFVEDWIEHVSTRSQRPENTIPHVSYMFDLALTHYRAELEWLNRTILDMKKRNHDEN
jgi:DNA-binding PadR family transcriptional regulator